MLGGRSESVKSAIVALTIQGRPTMPPIGGRPSAGMSREDVTDPCRSEEEKWRAAVAAQKVTQHEIERVNSVPAEREIRQLETIVADQRKSLSELQAKGANEGQTKMLRDNIQKNEERIADWKASVATAMKANNDAVLKVNKTFKKFQDCKAKNRKA
jgi:hypothetical protein